VSVRILAVAVVVGVFVGGFAYLLLPRHPTVAVVALKPEPARGREPIEPTPIAPDTAAAPIPPNTAVPRAARKTPTAAAPATGSEAVAELGTLRITTDVSGASVFIDRQFIGTAPVTAQNVKPGTHQLNVTAEGHDGIVLSIDVEPGPRDLSIRFKEVRLNATLAVVHKHRIGSCAGQLVATPQGLRYETSNKDDGFNVPLDALESLAVEYQDKNLKVKVRKGRQYNFTDRDGNADRLFVFQRDVDKVRQRLAKGDTPAD